MSARRWLTVSSTLRGPRPRLEPCHLDPSDLGYASFLSISLSNFSIPFQWQTLTNTWYDPENNQTGTDYSVLYLTDPNASPVDLNLSGMSITGPPAFDPAPAVPVPTGNVYAGEPATSLILATGSNGYEQALGSITDCTFQGGNITLGSGPWTVSGNTDLGALANTFSQGAFTFTSPHDTAFEGNQVYQAPHPDFCTDS